MLLSSAEQDLTTGGAGSKPSRPRPAETPSSTPDFGRPRRPTVQSDIQDTIQHPGNVLINVQGAFIVDEEQPGTPQSEDYEHDPQDIRLPNHTTVVSHVAVDVSRHVLSRAQLLYPAFPCDSFTPRHHHHHHHRHCCVAIMPC